MKIVFPHIPKCAGTSVKNQLVTRKDVYFDYFNHPTWVYMPDRESGRLKQNKLKNALVELDTWIVFGHFSSCTYDDFAYDLKIILLRDPLERAISHFYYVKQRLPNNKTTRRRHKEVALIKDGHMTIEEFVELDHIKYFYSKYYLNKLILDERLIVLPVDNLEMSFNKIMETSRIQLDPSILVNKSNYCGNFEHLRGNFSVDAALYDDLISRS